MTLVVVMGVSGSGKSTVGALLAARLGVPFVDADSLHPAANVAKMASGTPLDDEDRWPWLARVADELAAHPVGLVVACSALRASYRAALRRDNDRVFFAHLHPTFEVLSQRLLSRPEHFMPASLLQSQLDTLEDLEPEEWGIRIDAQSPASAVVEAIAEALGT